MNQFYNSAILVIQRKIDKGILKAGIYNHTLLQYKELYAKPTIPILKQHVDTLLSKLSNKDSRSIYYSLLKNHSENINAIIRRRKERLYWKVQRHNITNDVERSRWFESEGARSVTELIDFSDLIQLYKVLLEKTQPWGKLYPNVVL